MTTRDYEHDFAAIAADDALLDALAGGHVTETDDELGRLLVSWRGELDAAADAVEDVTATVPLDLGAARPAARVRWTRLHRHTAGVAAAAVVVLAGSAGAAAATGPHGPFGAVNRALFGTPAHDDSARLALVRSMLDRAQRGIDAAHAHGGASAAQLADLGDQLDAAGRVLAADPAAPSSLMARLTALRAELAGLDTLPTRPPVIGNDGQPARSAGDGGDGGASTQSGDGNHGGDGSDSSTGSGDGSSGTNDGTSGSDSTSGSDGTSGSGDSTSSGDGGTTSDSGGDTSSSDGGTSGSDGSTSGTGDAGGSDSGTTDPSSSDGGTGTDTGTSGSDSGTGTGTGTGG